MQRGYRELPARSRGQSVATEGSTRRSYRNSRYPGIRKHRRRDCWLVHTRRLPKIRCSGSRSRSSSNTYSRWRHRWMYKEARARRQCSATRSCHRPRRGAPIVHRRGYRSRTMAGRSRRPNNTRNSRLRKHLVASSMRRSLLRSRRGDPRCVRVHTRNRLRWRSARRRRHRHLRPPDPRRRVLRSAWLRPPALHWSAQSLTAATSMPKVQGRASRRISRAYA